MLNLSTFPFAQNSWQLTVLSRVSTARLDWSLKEQDCHQTSFFSHVSRQDLFLKSKSGALLSFCCRWSWLHLVVAKVQSRFEWFFRSKASFREGEPVEPQMGTGGWLKGARDVTKHYSSSDLRITERRKHIDKNTNKTLNTIELNRVSHFVFMCFLLLLR